MCSVCNKSVVNRGVGYQTTCLGCAGIGVYVGSVNLWVTSLSTRSGGVLWLFGFRDQPCLYRYCGYMLDFLSLHYFALDHYCKIPTRAH